MIVTDYYINKCDFHREQKVCRNEKIRAVTHRQTLRDIARTVTYLF